MAMVSKHVSYCRCDSETSLRARDSGQALGENHSQIRVSSDVVRNHNPWLEKNIKGHFPQICCLLDQGLCTIRNYSN